MISNFLYRFIQPLLKLFFHLLYHPFAFTYDLVAMIVSFGKWQQWVNQTRPYIHGSKVLELGHGPGHLQKTLRDSGYAVFGLDASSQMGRLAYKRLRRKSTTQSVPAISQNLVRARAEMAPFGENSFHTILSTFPTEYVFQQSTVAEIQRMLMPDGKLIILLSAWITGRSIFEKLLAYIYQITGQTPSPDTDLSKFCIPFSDAGLSSSLQWIELKSSRLLVLIAHKT